MESREEGGGFSIGPRTTMTLATMLTIVPLVVWAARMDHRVEQLERERVEEKQDRRELINKVNELLRRMPVRP